MAGKQPAFQFYTGDWLKDPALRACSVGARGLWIDMLCLMHESSRRGYLEHKTGKPVTLEQIARMTGCSTDEASHLLQELSDAGVCSCTEHGTYFSRRMVRDETKRSKTNERVHRHRKKRTSNGACNDDVTPPSSSSTSVTPHKPPSGGDKKRDYLFEAIAEVCGWSLDGLTSNSRGKLNKARKELADVGATPAEVRERAKRWRKQFNVTLTPTGLANNWPSLSGGPQGGGSAASPLDAMSAQELEGLYQRTLEKHPQLKGHPKGTDKVRQAMYRVWKGEQG